MSAIPMSLSNLPKAASLSKITSFIAKSSRLILDTCGWKGVRLLFTEPLSIG